MRLAPNQLDGQSPRRPARTFAAIVFPAASLRVLGHSDVEGIVGAPENVTVMHDGTEQVPKHCALRLARMRLAQGTNPGRIGGGGGSRTPVREALQPEDYMLSPFRFVRRWNSERARRATD
jgi:hypothetical protein